MKYLIKILFVALPIYATIVFNSCKKDNDEETPVTPVTPPAAICSPDTVFTPTGTGPRLIFKFKFDSTQARLDGFGNPSTVGSGNAAQSPKFNFMSQHYIELANSTDALGAGKVLYVGATSSAGGSPAIDYCASKVTREGVVFFSVPLSQITPGSSYSWLRVSLASQNYNITYKSSLLPGNGLASGTLASFIGYKTFISGYKINGHDHVPGSSVGGAGNHPQGYWGFETPVFGTNYFYEGQAPAGATTVPNPIFATSPIPSGSCVVTGQFTNSTGSSFTPLVITGTETSDIVITVSLSINKSFEWHEVIADGYYQPDAGEYAVDMGVRGMVPKIN